MTFELPEPAHKVGDYVMDCDYWQDLYTADQMQATYAAGRASAVDLMMLGLIQVVAKLQDRVAIAAPEDEPVAEVDIWVELGRDLYELKQFAGFRDLPIGNHELYIHPAPEKPTYEQGYAQGFKAGMREKP